MGFVLVDSPPIADREVRLRNLCSCIFTWPILCQVGRKTLTRSVNHLFNYFRHYRRSHCWMNTLQVQLILLTQQHFQKFAVPIWLVRLPHICSCCPHHFHHYSAVVHSHDMLRLWNYQTMMTLLMVQWFLVVQVPWVGTSWCRHCDSTLEHWQCSFLMMQLSWLCLPAQTFFKTNGSAARRNCYLL